MLIVRLCTKDNVAKERCIYWLKYITRRAISPFGFGQANIRNKALFVGLKEAPPPREYSA
jgi:hypothetical protein